jgi:hypothetical protein
MFCCSQQLSPKVTRRPSHFSPLMILNVFHLVLHINFPNHYFFLFSFFPPSKRFPLSLIFRKKKRNLRLYVFFGTHSQTQFPTRCFFLRHKSDGEKQFFFQPKRQFIIPTPCADPLNMYSNCIKGTKDQIKGRGEGGPDNKDVAHPHKARRGISNKTQGPPSSKK